MRVIAGEFRSRKLKTPEGMETRPTPDRLRESLFSILQEEIEGSIFLDAYAGSGAVGIEALSRGASRVIFVENSRNAVNVLRENLAALKVGRRAEIVTGKVQKALSTHAADLVFLDPPYDKQSEYGIAMQALGQQEGNVTLPRMVMVQHSVRFDPGEICGLLQRNRIVRQGENAISFYRLL